MSKITTHMNSFMVQASDHYKTLQVNNFGKKMSSSSTALASRLDNTLTPHESFNQDMHTCTSTTRTHYCNVVTTSSTRGSVRSMQSNRSGTARKRTVCQDGHKLTPVKENKKND